MRISIFGLGYVGTVCAAALARSGFEVLGVDVNETKNAQINEGRSPIVEPGLEELIGEAVGAKRLSATSDHAACSRESSDALADLRRHSQPQQRKPRHEPRRGRSRARSAVTCADRDGRHTVVVRSTLLPGTTLARRSRCSKRRRARAAAIGFGLAYNPEFLREGSAIADFYDPPYTLVGGLDDASARRAAALRRARRAAAPW